MFTLLWKEFVTDFVSVLAVTTTAVIGFGAETLIKENTKTQAQAKSETKAETKAETRNSNNNQAYFPANPYAFMPNGLVMNTYPGSTNGMIIKWTIPGTKIAIFEWDEDFIYGSHYHLMSVEWDNAHIGDHWKAGDMVPEPWNTTFFGG